MHPNRGRPGQSSSKPFRDALRQVIAEAKGNPRKLRRIAEKLYDKAVGGDIHAIAIIADRLDGKAVQGIGQDSELGPVIVRWLDPSEAQLDKALDTMSDGNATQPQHGDK